MPTQVGAGLGAVTTAVTLPPLPPPSRTASSLVLSRSPAIAIPARLGQLGDRLVHVASTGQRLE